MEELVAELNAAFLSAVLGPTPSFREEHAAYIAGLHGSSSGSAQPLSQRKRKRAAAILPQRSVSAVQRQRRAHVTPVAVELDAWACIKRT